MWVYYAYGGTLPDRHREWVLHDATCRTWVLRSFLRSLVQVSPVAAALLVGLGVFGESWPLALGATLLGVLVVVRISLSLAEQSAEGRLVRHGFPPGHAAAVRRQADADAAARYRAVWRQE
ncbi:hypothetical protein GCM10010470_33230 [Saccharopolyspora taberi]|uniref:DUF5313 domain-containing protein n=1 Tax=Saccharopolyspora taberi TaxID=60895 RepID=A0ABN3VDY4_9PSEU